MRRPRGRCRAVFFLTAIDGGMIHSFVRQQNRTVSVVVSAPKPGPGRASLMTTPWLLTCPPNAALVNLIRGWRNRSTHRFTASFQGFSASCYELKGGFRWGFAL